MSAWVLMYLFVIVDQLREAMSGYGGATMCAVFATIVYGMFFIFSRMSIDVETRTVEDFDERWEKLKKGMFAKFGRRILYVMWFIPIFMFTVHTLLPTQKNLAILIGAGATYEAVTSESGKRIGGKVIQLLEEKLDGAIQGDKPLMPNMKENSGEKEKVKKEEIQHAT